MTPPKHTHTTQTHTHHTNTHTHTPHIHTPHTHTTNTHTTNTHTTNTDTTNTQTHTHTHTTNTHTTNTDTTNTHTHTHTHTTHTLIFSDSAGVLFFFISITFLPSLTIFISRLRKVSEFYMRLIYAFQHYSIVCVCVCVLRILFIILKGLENVDIQFGMQSIKNVELQCQQSICKSHSITPHSAVGILNFHDGVYIDYDLQKEAASFSETSVTTYHITRRHNTVEQNFHYWHFSVLPARTAFHKVQQNEPQP